MFYLKHIFQNFYFILFFTTAHLWHDNHYTSICKCTWGMKGQGLDLSLQEGVSHTYTLRLG